MKNIQYIVDNNLCIGCGACTVACPVNCINIFENIAGFYQAKVDETKCIKCKKCIDVCPGWNSSTKQLQLSFKEPLIIHSKNKNIRENSQSGGFITSFLINLLEKKEINGACIVSMKNPSNNLRPEGIIARDRQSIINSSGSQYTTINILSSLKYLKSDDKIAFVGLPCHMQGLNRLMQKGIISPQQISIKIGLICARILSYNAVNNLINKCSVDTTPIFYRFRFKKYDNWPGKFYVKTSSGKQFFLKDNERAKQRKIYSHPRCFLCWDKFNQYADIVVGDAWGVEEDKKGVSIVIPRTSTGKIFLKNSLKESDLFQYKLIDDSSKILKGQKIYNRLAEWNFVKTIWGKKYCDIPNINIVNNDYTEKMSQIQLSKNLEDDVHLYYLLNKTRNKMIYKIIIIYRIVLHYLTNLLFKIVRKINNLLRRLFK